MPLVVQKFGGTSVADPERIREVADHVARTRRRGDDVVVVVSAMGKETDELLRLAAEVSKVRPGREMDMLITAGERKATALLCMALHDLGVAGRQLHRAARPASSPTAPTPTPRSSSCAPTACARRWPPAACRWSAAPRACRPTSDVTFLGRGGSDTTAVALAHALEADSCELYTDVSGVFTADPRVVPERPPHGHGQLRRDARDDGQRLPEAGHAVASSSPAPGACACTSVPRSPGSPAPGSKRRIRPWSRPSSRPSCTTRSEAKVTVSGVPDQPGIAARLFRLLADRDVNVDMIVQNVSDHGVTDISFTLPHEDLADEPRRSRRRWPREIGATAVTHRRRHRPGEPRRRRHEVEPRRGRHASSRRWPQAGINIEMISHVGHPDLLHRARGRGRAGRPGPPHRLRP